MLLRIPAIVNSHFHAMGERAWRGKLEIAFLRQVFTIRQAGV